VACPASTHPRARDTTLAPCEHVFLFGSDGVVLRLEEQRVDAFVVVVGWLVLGVAAGLVDLLLEAVCPVAAVGFAEQVERCQVERLGQPGAVGEGADSVADPGVDLVEDLLDRSSRVQAVGLPGGEIWP
jgi:hypothetical protein